MELFSGVVPFVTTAQEKSFRRAARRLGVTPSAISKAIARLEGELGVRLLNRTSRAVTLTSEGEAFFERSRHAVEAMRAAREIASEAQRAPRGVLRVSLPQALGRLTIVPALPRLLARHPTLSIEAVLTDRKVQLPEETIDVAVRFGELDDSSGVARRLRRVSYITAAAPSYLGRYGRPTKPSDLLEHNCLRFRPPSGAPHAWDYRQRQTGETIRIEPTGTLTADQGDALVAAAVAGLGIIRALDFMIAGELARDELVDILGGWSGSSIPLAVLAAPGRHDSPKVRAFMDFMLELLGD